MGTQLALPLDRDPRGPRPDDRRGEPAVWVRRLWILDELASGEEHVIRRVDLRRGLNVLWAAPTSGSGNRLFQGRLSGHTAGKTTFCRLIRHVLGEPTFGTATARQRIRAKFPTAWVVGEILIGGELWTGARPLGLGHHPFALRGVGIEGIFDGTTREGYDALLEAIDAAIVRPLPVSRFPSADQRIRWDHLLPWLTRDQESRFASFIEWRDSSSESDSPKIPADDRYVLVRAVLGLISDEERAEQRANAELVAKKQESVARAPILAHQVEVDRQRLLSLLGADAQRVADGPLFGGDARAILATQREALAHEESALGGDRVEQLRAAWEAEVAARAEAKRAVHEIESKLAPSPGAPGKGPSRAAALAVLATLPSDRQTCGVPLAVAREHGCPIASASPRGKKRATKGDASKGGSAPGIDAAEREAIEAALAAELAGAKEAEERAVASEQGAHAALSAAERERDADVGRIAKQRAAIEQAEWLVGQVEEGRRRAEAEDEELARIEKELRRSYERQESFRRRHAVALGKISERFAYVVRAVLGEHMGAKIEDDGRSLALRIEEHGDRESAALATLKLIAFDLAALTASVEGHGAFPRFLIHDGPREADMDQAIYERLFLFAKSLEESYSGAEPSFQYILTTTAPPPTEVQRAPWLLQPVLDASRAAGRLLKVDL